MADEPQGASGSAFEILGRIGVDLAALDASLSKSEGRAKAHAESLNRIFATVKGPDPGAGKATSKLRKSLGQAIFNEGFMPGDTPGAVGEGAGGGGGEGGGHSATANFAHLARVARHTLLPALQQLNPEMGQFISVGAQSARTAVFFGGAMGGVEIGRAHV